MPKKIFIIPALIGSLLVLGFMAAIVSRPSNKNISQVEPTPFESPVVAKASDKPPERPLKQPSTSSQFNFPKATCGDKQTGDNDTWYPVFVDGGDLETIRHNFCADAATTVRKDSKVESVQLASFTSRDRAIEFAKAVGGDVGQPTYPDVASSSPDPQAETVSSTSSASDEAVLTANVPDSRINLRDTPSATGRELGYGLVGDRVEILEQTRSDGYTWHRVRFPRSGAVGWIRSDFVNVVSASQTSQPSSEPQTYSSSPDATYTSTATATTSSGGNCNSPDDVDSRGYRCGGRAASVRSGGGGRRRR